MNLNNFKSLSINRRTEGYERRAILRFINCSESKVNDIRFGDANKNEPDIIMETTQFFNSPEFKTIGIEITDVFKDSNQAKFKRSPNAKYDEKTLYSKREDLIKSLGIGIRKKFGKTYEKNNIDKLVLLLVNETDRKTPLFSDTPFTVFPCGTPVGEITAMQKVEEELFELENSAKFDEIKILTYKENGGSLVLGVNFE